MGLWQRLFGSPARPEETLRLTRRVMDLMAEGRTDDEIERILYKEGASIERAASVVRQVRHLRDLTRGR